MMTYKKISPIAAARKLVAVLQLDKKEVSAIYIYAILAGLVQLVTPLGIQSIIGFVMAGALFFHFRANKIRTGFPAMLLIVLATLGIATL